MCFGNFFENDCLCWIILIALILFLCCSDDC